jgi:outer membrane protein
MKRALVLSLFLVSSLAYAEQGTSLPRKMTADIVGREAARNSFSAKAQAASLKAAAARVDQAWSSFLPKLDLTARYTRLSNVSNPALSFGAPAGSAVLVTPDAPGTPNPRVLAVAAPNTSFSFPVILDNFLLSAQIAVPISDYFLRINQGHSAALHAKEAAEFDLLAARAKASADGKLAFWSVVRARGALQVAEQAREDVKQRTADIRAQATVGNASQADVLRAETAFAAADLQVERLKNLVVLTEKQVRLALHVDDAMEFENGEDLDAMPALPTGALADYVAEAKRSRAEVLSIEKNLEALKRQSKIAGAGLYPQVAAFGQVDLANPNQRRFPVSQDWYPTWSAGLQATWSPNALVSAGAASAEVDARAASLEATREQLQEGLELEVTQAFQATKEAEISLNTAKKELESATEAMRVARELYRAGRATTTLITDAETDLTKARLEVINAKVDAKTAKVRLLHATGKDLSEVK